VTAILLAAGVGKRLHGRSGGRPKCLIEVGGKTLLCRLLDALAAAGVSDVAVVVGFGAEAVRDALDPPPPGLRIGVVANPRYREGAILSLWAARAALTGPVLVMDADVLCAPTLMLLVEGGRVRNVVRGGAPGYELSGESVGFLKLSGEAARLLADLLERRLAAGDTDIEHEEVYPELLALVEVGYERIDGLPWTEIDFPEDVTHAEREILPRLGE